MPAYAPTLWEGRARHTDPATSKAAAASVDGHALGSLLSDCLAVVECHRSGVTRDEVFADVRHAHPLTDRSSVSRRLTTLESEGLIVSAGERRAVSGRMQTVWVIR